MQKIIPCCYHPTTAILIDDDLDFLNSLVLALVPHYRCLPFLSPHQALQFLLKHPQNDLTHACLRPDYLPALQVAVNLTPIYQQVFNRNRFKQAIVCIIDYDMPGLNGLELARQLKAKLPVKIIMLTGEADHTTAVRAFNEQVIDFFVLKSQPNHRQQLLAHFQQLQWDYFATSSNAILKSLAAQPNHPLHDADFIELFQHICDERCIIEFYLADESGSFLMLDAAGQISWLLVKTEEDMDMLAELADNDGLPDLSTALTNHQKIACYPTLTDNTSPAQTWKIHDAIQLKDKPIYYQLLKKDQGYALKNTRRILSYKEFLRLE